MRVRSRVAQLAVSAGLMAPFAVFAQTDPVADGITALGAKITTYGTALVALAVLAIPFAIGIKYLKKAKGAAG